MPRSSSHDRTVERVALSPSDSNRGPSGIATALQRGGSRETEGQRAQPVRVVLLLRGMKTLAVPPRPAENQRHRVAAYLAAHPKGAASTIRARHPPGHAFKSASRGGRSGAQLRNRQLRTSRHLAEPRRSSLSRELRQRQLVDSACPAGCPRQHSPRGSPRPRCRRTWSAWPWGSRTGRLVEDLAQALKGISVRRRRRRGAAGRTCPGRGKWYFLSMRLP